MTLALLARVTTTGSKIKIAYFKNIKKKVNATAL